MGQMLIRRLDDVTIDRLKKRAAENRTSAEEEARRVLAAGVGGSDLEAWLARAKSIRDRIGAMPGPDSTELLRWDRDRDDRAVFDGYGD